MLIILFDKTWGSDKDNKKRIPFSNDTKHMRFKNPEICVSFFWNESLETV